MPTTRRQAALGKLDTLPNQKSEDVGSAKVRKQDVRTPDPAEAKQAPPSKKKKQAPASGVKGEQKTYEPQTGKAARAR